MDVLFTFNESVDEQLRACIVEDAERIVENLGGTFKKLGNSISVSYNAHIAGATKQIITNSGCDFLLQPAKEGLLAEYRVY